jgi:7-cyano-7-deazaguanine synthase
VKKKAIVLLSGGLDSAVSLWWARSRGYSCRALSFDYGQRHKKELVQARKLARVAGIPFDTVHIQLPWSRSSLTNKSQKLPTHSLAQISKNGVPSTYVPARNTLFLSFAMSLADEEKATALVIGANAIDYSGYPDCRWPFLKAFERVANLGSKIGTDGKMKIKILAPLVRLNKKQIVQLGQKLKVPFELTWSCYQGGRRTCGHCDSCLLRAKGFQEAGIEDPASAKATGGKRRP